MKKTILIIISFLFTLNLFSQIDAVKIQSAKKAYDAKEYNIALESLNEVTSVGRKSKLFNYYKGYAHFELKQYDSAEVYLKKYLLLDLTNEEVAGKLGDIDFEKKKNIHEENIKAQKTKFLNNALKFFEIHGDIRSFKEYSVKDGGDKTTITYNLNININKIFSTYHSEYTVAGSKSNYYTENTYVLSESGSILSSQSETSQTNYTYKGDLLEKMEYTTYRKGMNTLNETFFYYDSNSFKKSIISFENKVKTAEFSMINNNLGLPTSQTFVISGKTYYSTYSYKYDSQNNWIEKIENSNLFGKIVTIREIKYN